MDAYQELNQKNFRAMSDGLKSLRAEKELLSQRITSLEAQNMQITNDMAVLRQQYGLLLARVQGNGATS